MKKKIKYFPYCLCRSRCLTHSVTPRETKYTAGNIRTVIFTVVTSVFIYKKLRFAVHAKHQAGAGFQFCPSREDFQEDSFSVVVSSILVQTEGQTGKVEFSNLSRSLSVDGTLVYFNCHGIWLETEDLECGFQKLIE